jgi:hypothetical protein
MTWPKVSGDQQPVRRNADAHFGRAVAPTGTYLRHRRYFDTRAQDCAIAGASPKWRGWAHSMNTVGQSRSDGPYTVGMEEELFLVDADSLACVKDMPEAFQAEAERRLG